MASNEFINLMTKIHTEKHGILSTHIKVEKIDGGFLGEATVVLEKNGKQTTVKSSEPDFFEYVIHLERVADEKGKYKFARMRDLNQYWGDIEHLVDKDHSKIKTAIGEMTSGKFEFSYNPIKLIDDLIVHNGSPKNRKFLPLKKDYHYILAARLLESQQILRIQKEVIRKNPEIQKIIDAVGQITMAFRPTGNVIKDYKFYKSFVNFDIQALMKRISTQSKVINDTMKEFFQRGSVPGDIAIPRLMGIYGRVMELSAPVLNLLRIGLELRGGNQRLVRQLSLTENVARLKTDPNYGHIFSCLDEMIRHSDAHASITVADGIVNLIDARGPEAKIVRTYKFKEIVQMIREMQRSLFPALITTLILQEIAMIDLLLTSPEYKHLLLAVNNI
jgi:hypothetical protein